MTTAQKIFLGLMAVALVVAGIVFIERPSSGHPAGTTNFVNDLRQGVTWFTNIVYFGSSQQTTIDGSGCMTVGASGSKACQAQFGTCNLSTSVASFAATSTVQFLCSVPGVSAGDLVIADLPPGAGTNTGNGAGSLFGGFNITSAYATTSNVIGVTLLNLTGAATTSYSQATTTVEYRIIH